MIFVRSGKHFELFSTRCTRSLVGRGFFHATMMRHCKVSLVFSKTWSSLQVLYLLLPRPRCLLLRIFGLIFKLLSHSVEQTLRNVENTTAAPCQAFAVLSHCCNAHRKLLSSLWSLSTSTGTVNFLPAATLIIHATTSSISAVLLKLNKFLLVKLQQKRPRQTRELHYCECNIKKWGYPKMPCTKMAMEQNNQHVNPWTGYD